MTRSTGPTPNATDIGHDHYVARVTNDDGALVAVIEWHHDPHGDWCSGYVRIGGPAWTLDSEDPLTLSPSIRCVECDDHGFIRDGRWVPA